MSEGLRTRETRLGSLLGDLLDDLATESLSPAASSVAAMNVAIAAALTAKSARRSAGELDSAVATAAQADSLRRRALLLVSLNTEAYEREVATLSASAGRESGGEGGRDRNLEIRDALTKTSDALVSLLQVACDVCVLADLVARRGRPGAQMDAAVAATQAEAGARAAMELIEINLLSDELVDAKREARRALATASEAAGKARAAAL